MMKLATASLRNLLTALQAARLRAFYALAGLAMAPHIALAELPEVEEPTNGGGGGLFETIQGYGADIAVLAGLIIATVAFIVVALSAIAKFRQATQRDGQWGDFGAVVVVGVVLVIVVIWLMNQAAEILVA